MEITLISLIEDVGCLGLRQLSSHIKNAGHSTKLILLPRFYSEGNITQDGYRYPLSQTVLQQIAEMCSTSDIIGLSLMSCHLDNSVQITEYLKKLNKPIILGGIHPTIRPYECIDYADLVCVGEGENSVVDLLNNMNHMDKILDGTITINGILSQKTQPITVGKLITDLNTLELPDFGMEHEFILYNGKIIKMSYSILSEYLHGSYRIASSRGCVSSCTYCMNNAFNRLYGVKVMPIRWRSIDNIITELKWAKDTINLTEINFVDDTFLSRPFEQIEEFATRYKQEINLPFRIMATPSAVTYEKIKMLLEANSFNIGIGIQSVYEPVRKMYKRHESLEQINNAIKTFKDISKGSTNNITVRYDFILDNPWGGEVDTEANIRFVMSSEMPNEINLFTLMFYPGTELYEKAKAEGFIKDELNEIYRRTQNSQKVTYMNEVFRLLYDGCPNIIIKVLINHRVKIRSIRLVKVLRITTKMIWYAKNVWYIKNPMNVVKFKIEKMFMRTVVRPKQFNGNVGRL